MEKLGKEPAFPIDAIDKNNTGTNGMSKRFYAACAAMQGLISSEHWVAAITKEKLTIEVGLKMTVKVAYLYADELLKQENE